MEVRLEAPETKLEAPETWLEVMEAKLETSLSDSHWVLGLGLQFLRTSVNPILKDHFV